MTIENTINQIKQNVKSFIHGYIQHLRWTNNNLAAIKSAEKQEGQYHCFFSTVDSYLTVNSIPQTVSLVEQWTYFNEKYLRENNLPLTVCFCHVTYAIQNESTLYSCLNVKELLAQSRREIWRLSDWNWTRTQNHLVRKRTLNHLAKLAKWLSCVLSSYLYVAFDCMFL